MAKKKDTEQKPPAQGPTPSPEEIRRAHVETNAKDRLSDQAKTLQELLTGDLKKSDRIQAIIAVGEAILSLGLQTKGRLRALTGHSDAYLESKAAYIKSGMRKATLIFDTWDKDMMAWSEFADVLKPVLESAARTVKDLDLPGMKAAIAPSGPALFDDEGQPTEKAVAPPAPPPAAPAAPKAEAEPKKPEPPAPAPGPANVAGREIQTLGMTEGPIIDVELEHSAHGLDGLDKGDAEDVVNNLLLDLEEACITEEGAKRKDWKAAEAAWVATWPEDCSLAETKKVYDRVFFALNHRKPLTWAVVTDEEMDTAFAAQRAAGE